MPKKDSTFPRNMVSHLTEPAANRLIKTRIVRHLAAREIYLTFLKPMMAACGETDPNELMLDGRMNADMVVGAIETMGFWGFADTRKCIIHCWWDEDCSEMQIVAFLCHELEHILAPCRPTIEEKRCDLTAAIAVTAFRLLETIKKGEK